MAAKGEVVPAEWAHVDELAETMRQADVDEIWASSYSTPQSALSCAMRSSLQVWTGLIDGQVACMFGVVPQSMMGGTGFAWMLGSDLVERHQKLFLRRCRENVRMMAEQFDYLHNYVDDRNVKAIRWLKWLGFEMGDPEPFGVLGLPFRHFEMRVK